MGSFEMHNPSFQIDVYLRDTPPKWGILCNGRLWRLYHETTSYKLDSYYEVDLPSLLARGDLETFKYFYLFFRLEALPRAVDGDSFLDRVLELLALGDQRLEDHFLLLSLVGGKVRISELSVDLRNLRLLDGQEVLERVDGLHPLHLDL